MNSFQAFESFLRVAPIG